MAATKIEWTNATWNPIAGCSIVSPGCHNCYAMTMARRLEAMGQEKYRGLTKRTNGKTLWTGKIALDEEALAAPLRWKKPRRVFVNSMSDLFHDDVPDEFIDRVFAVMALCPQHTFQVLTKRAERMAAYLDESRQDMRVTFVGNAAIRMKLTDDDFRGPWPLKNVWLGVSAEDQQRADERLPWLLKTPAAVRFVSAEPLLGPVNLWSDANYRLPNGGTGSAFNWGNGVQWVIVGGESGHHARPMHPQWARSLRDQCQAAGVPFFFKQWGEWAQVGTRGEFCFNPGAPVRELVTMDRVGKKAAGRLLDGREWSEFPATHPLTP